MADALALTAGLDDIGLDRTRRRIVVELALTYALILLVIWTPRPWQKMLWWVAAGALLVIAGLSYKGIQSLGLRRGNLFRSSWVVAVALLLSAVAVAIAIPLETLRLPAGGVQGFIATYWAYALWAGVQQLLLQGFFLPRCLRLVNGTSSAAFLAAALFALAHLPNPILTPVTLIWGFAACMLFLHYRSLYPLAIAHAILGITIAITIPGPVDHNMRVGLGYLTYHPHIHTAAHLTQP
jgi:hypothetical protein